MADKYRSLKVAELKDLLAKAGLPGTGKKEELIDRLVQHEQKKQDINAVDVVEDLENEYPELEGEFEDSKIDVDDLTAGSTEVDLSTSFKTNAPVETSATSKNTLNPNSTTTTQTAPQPTPEVVVKTSGFKFKPVIFKKTEANGATNNNAEKRKEPPVNDEFELRKQERAKRFAKELAYELPGGSKKIKANNATTTTVTDTKRTPGSKLIDDAEKLSKRMEKWGVINKKAAASIGVSAPKDGSKPQSKPTANPEEEEKKKARAQRFSSHLQKT